MAEHTPRQRHGPQGQQGKLPDGVFMFRLPGVSESHTPVTTLLDPDTAPAGELAALHHERREIRIAHDEVKACMLGPGAPLRSKTPELVQQELEGPRLANYAVRSLIHEAAGRVDTDTDRLSFLHAVNVVRCRIVHPGAFPTDGTANR